MAERRMFSKTIIDSDAFLDMPLSAQALYFHLSMRADDDGFLNNAQKIIRMTNASRNDYDLLIVKRFIIQFNDGICVIRHWRIHNYIRVDRYKPTMYQSEMKNLVVNENKSYSIKEELLQSRDSHGVPDDNQMDTQGSKDKDRLGKESRGEVRKRCGKNKDAEDRNEEDKCGDYSYKREMCIEIGSQEEFKTEDENIKYKSSGLKKGEAAHKADINQLEQITKMWNSLEVSKIISIKNNRLKAVNARIREFGIERLLETIESINRSSFLKGNNDRKWTITFDWFIKSANFIKVLEGNYLDKCEEGNNSDGKFNNFNARKCDYDLLEKKLLGWEKEE